MKHKLLSGNNNIEHRSVFFLLLIKAPSKNIILFFFKFQSLGIKGIDILSLTSLEAASLSPKEIKERSNREMRNKSLGREENEEEELPKSQLPDSQRKLVIYYLNLRSLKLF